MASIVRWISKFSPRMNLFASFSFVFTNDGANHSQKCPLYIRWVNSCCLQSRTTFGKYYFRNSFLNRDHGFTLPFSPRISQYPITTILHPLSGWMTKRIPSHGLGSSLIKKIFSIGDSHNCASTGSLVLPLKVRGHTILNPKNILPLMYVTSYWLAQWPPLLEPWPEKIPTSNSSWGLFPPMVLLEVVQPRIFLLQSLHISFSYFRMT